MSYWSLDEEGAYGNNFTLYNAQMTVQRKKHQPKGDMSNLMLGSSSVSVRHERYGRRVAQ